MAKRERDSEELQSSLEEGEFGEISVSQLV